MQAQGTERLRDRRWFRWTSQIAIILAAYLGIRAFQTWGTADGVAPELDAAALDGRRLSLSELRREGPVLVHFWATWCGVCRVEEGNIESVAEDHRVITVATRSPLHDIQRYAQEQALEMPVLPDPDGRLASAWGVRSFPTSFVVGEDGQIRHVEVGYTTELGLRARLLLADLL